MRVKCSTESLLNLRRDLIRGRLEYLAEPRHLDRLSPLERRPVSARGEEDLSNAGANLRRDPLPVVAPGAPSETLPGIIVGRERASTPQLPAAAYNQLTRPTNREGEIWVFAASHTFIDNYQTYSLISLNAQPLLCEALDYWNAGRLK